MAIIYSYPLMSDPLSGSDLMLISNMNSNERPTRSVTLQQIADFASASGVAGVGQIVAGDNITLDPAEGTGIVTINAQVPASAAYTFSNTAATQSGDALLRLTDGTNVSNVAIKEGDNITITDNEESALTINAAFPCWDLAAAEAQEGEVTITLSDGDAEGSCPDSTITFVEGNNITMEVNEAGDQITFTASGGGQGMTDWIIAGDTGSETVTDGNTVTIAGGNVITTEAAATDTVTVSHDAVTRNNVSGTSNLNFGDTFNAITAITSSTQGHITDVTTTALTLPAAPTTTAETGFSPLSIYDGENTLGVQAGPITMFAHMTSDVTMAVNACKLMLPETPSTGVQADQKDAEFSVAIYSGSLSEYFNSNGAEVPQLLGEFEYTPGASAVFGIKKVLTKGEVPPDIQLNAGEDYILAVSVSGAGPLLWGKGAQNTVGGEPPVTYGTEVFKERYLNVGKNAGYLNSNGGFAAAGDFDTIIPTSLEGAFAWNWKYCIHFFKEALAEEEGEVDENDTDGDGVPNDQDAFPNDPEESVDTDGDGVGNNADTDDDNDGYSDEEEVDAGSDPLDSNSTPDNVGEEAAEEG